MLSSHDAVCRGYYSGLQPAQCTKAEGKRVPATHDADVAGGILEAFAYQFNLHQLSNASAIWLGIQPPDLFIFVFLPPLLVDSALRIDYYMFRKVRQHKKIAGEPVCDSALC